MATTTPNFGWSVPTSTDLVKDGATAIETLGDAIDASLVDLKGGSSGQVLAKNSATDMDFVWVAQDDSNAIQNAIVDAKGDLIAATGDNTPARLAVGTDGQVLKANSATATGLEWATDNSGMTNPLTTTGDTIYSSSGTTPARLGIGSTGQVLTVAAGLPSWAAAGGTSGYTLLNAGGTALSGSGTVTVSGITSNDLLVYVTGAATAGTNVNMTYRFNSTATNHYAAGLRIIGASSYAASNFDQVQESNSGAIPLAYTANSASRPSRGFLMVQGCKSTGVKPLWFSGANDPGSGSGQWSHSGGGYFDAAAAITSVSIILGSGTFNAGTIFVYGRN
jgi:hypothetical protein